MAKDKHIVDSISSDGNEVDDFEFATMIKRYTGDGGDVVVPDGVLAIGDEAFGACIGLKNIIIPNSVQSIGTGAFGACTGLTEITIPNSVTSIGVGAFIGCTKLKKVIIPHSIRSIEAGVFLQCGGLTSVTLPDSISLIGDYAFCGCGKLETIEYQGSKKQWKDILKGDDWCDDTGEYKIYCTDGVLSKKASA